MALEKAKQELEKFVQLKTTLRPSFVDVLLNAEEVVRCKDCKCYDNKTMECCGRSGVFYADDYCSRGRER